MVKGFVSLFLKNKAEGDSNSSLSCSGNRSHCQSKVNRSLARRRRLRFAISRPQSTARSSENV
jgi:hypothetical protein